ncbi:MAG: hypothetical protein ACFFEF_18750 [Candidatus Thorarchaeota archaeon]
MVDNQEKDDVLDGILLVLSKPMTRWILQILLGVDPIRNRGRSAD